MSITHAGNSGPKSVHRRSGVTGGKQHLGRRPPVQPGNTLAQHVALEASRGICVC